MSISGHQVTDHRQAALVQSPESFVGIDRDYVSKMLQNMGVDLNHTLGPSMILGSFDVMASADLAIKLPSGANFEAALQCFHTLKHVQPVEVRKVQVRVLNLVHRLCAPNMTDDRFQAIRGRLEVCGSIPLN